MAANQVESGQGEGAGTVGNLRPEAEDHGLQDALLNPPVSVGNGSALGDQEEPNRVVQRNPSLPNLDRMSQMPPVSNGSIVSHNSRSSKSSTSSKLSAKGKLKLEEKLAKIRDQKRRLRLQAEEERLEDEEKLIVLRAEVESEEDDVDSISNVIEVPQTRQDVATWVAQTTGVADKPEDHQDQVHLTRPLNDAPLPRFGQATHTTQSDRDNSYGRNAEDETFNKMAQCFASAMQNVIQTTRPNADLKTFAARQTGAKYLPEFHGEPEEWPTFIGQFETSTKLCGYTNEENIFRLQRSLKGKAKESVASMLSSASHLDEILDVLKRRFGRPDIIIKKMMEKARNAPTPSEGDFQALVDFSIVVKNFCVTAEALELPLYLNNPQIMEEFRKKLPSHLQLEWGRHVARTKGDGDLRNFCEFLDEVSSGAELVCDVASHQSKRQKNRDQCFVISNLGCLLKCKEAHSLSGCQKFRKMKTDERWECVKKLHVCFLCLEKGHRIESCPNPIPCEKDGCTRSHHTLLHYPGRKKQEESSNKDGDGQQAKPTSNKDGNGQQQKSTPKFTGVVSQSQTQVGDVLMKIAPVQLVGPTGTVTVNAFLDDGSTCTLLDEEIAKRLGIDGERNPLHLNWLGGKSEYDNSSQIVSLRIRGLDEKEEFDLTNVRTKRNLNLPVKPLSDYKNARKWKHLESVPFPEVLPQKPAIIIGGDHSHLMLPRKACEGPSNAPIAIYTHLGWVMHGPSGKIPTLKAGHVSMINVEGMDPDQALHDLVKEQFRLEALGVVNCNKLPQSKENERADDLMEKKSQRTADRWETCMLWKNENMKLPESKASAIRRLTTLEKQMDKDDSFASMYCGKIEEYLKKGFCRKLTPEESVESDRTWYLPHFGTTNPNKPGKLRLVFDCAAKANGMSLNDALLQGPDLMSPLLKVLMKFRQGEVAFSGDIRDMFHMVKIVQEDVAALRFLWRGRDRNRKPDVYTMDVMVFGAVSSSYQAQWIKNRNAMEFQEEFPEAVDAILNRHYVDDYLDSCETVEEAIKKIENVREIHRRGGFEIRGWLCNKTEVLNSVDPDSKTEGSLQVKEDKLERVLGLFWDPKLDVFKFKTTFSRVDPKIISGEKIPTKRELLKLVMSMFDPLGFIAHLTVRGRILLQDVWRSEIGWDEKLKPEQEPKWSSFLGQIMQISETVIPRCYAPGISRSLDIQLHVFCDASQQAFSCVGYLRVTGRGGDVSANIVMAKARVSPIKSVSIPRLEMEAALMSGRMLKFIVENLDIKINSSHLWTDSRNVLCWIRAADPSRFKTYIAHRIGEILDLTEVENWRWVPTADNVADDATRDISLADVTKGSRWFNGPEFLKKPESEWPEEKRTEPVDVKDEDLEVKKACCMITSIGDDVPDVKKYSDWMKLIRVTAWMIRFGRNCAAKRRNEDKNKNGCLLVNEISNAIKHWIQRSQESTFGEEIQCLTDGKEMPKSSRLSTLSPILMDGILKVNSRIINAPQLRDETKYPAILDAKHQWTKLLVEWYHRLYDHQGVELICNEIRQRYWILGLKAAVKKAARQCLECQMRNAKMIPPQMAALPEVRVKQPPRPFTYVGVDYFGPLDVINGRKHEKRYGVLFTCLSTRAVHLDVAFSLSTDDFLMALHRFVSRRGEPSEIWSDNGTNFRGADTELKKALAEMKQEKIQDDMTTRGITWNFIPPGAPHMGGAWERLVRSVKNAMSVILKGRSLTDQVLMTVLAEAEASVNSRPLTVVSSDKDDPEAITPNCFLLGTTSTKQPPGDFKDEDLSLRKKWRHVQVLANNFWSRWLKEYLPSLALRTKWNKDTPDVKVGELVFVADSNQQRNQWTKGLVVEVFRQKKDQRVRVVDVRTANGIIRRPVTKLYRINGWTSDSNN